MAAQLAEISWQRSVGRDQLPLNLSVAVTTLTRKTAAGLIQDSCRADTRQMARLTSLGVRKSTKKREGS